MFQVGAAQHSVYNFTSFVLCWLGKTTINQKKSYNLKICSTMENVPEGIK